MTDAEQRLILEWFAAGDCGLSSRALANEFAGLPQEKRWGISHPHDGGDLGRCVRLIDRVPAARAAVDALAGKNKYWAALAPEWDRLTAAWRSGASDVYPMMRAILDPIDRADPKVVQLGNGASVRFGR